MAYINATATVSLTDRITAGLRTVALRYKRHRLYRETFTALNALSDRELHDLNLGRWQLRDAAYTSATAAVMG